MRSRGTWDYQYHIYKYIYITSAEQHAFLPQDSTRALLQPGFKIRPITFRQPQVQGETSPQIALQSGSPFLFLPKQRQNKVQDNKIFFHFDYCLRFWRAQQFLINLSS